MKTNQINRRELTGNRESDWNTFKAILREAGGIEMFMLNDNPNIHFVTHYPDFEEGGYMLEGGKQYYREMLTHYGPEKTRRIYARFYIDPDRL